RFVNGTRVKILTARNHASPGRHVLTESPSERHASKDRSTTSSPKHQTSRSNQNQQGYSERESIGQRKSKSVDRELVPDQIGEEAGERAVLSNHRFPGGDRREIRCFIRATVSRKRKLATAV
ncbi:unnamed protein product, partial [Brassica napus]